VTRRQWRLLVGLTVFNTIALGWLAFAPNSSKWMQDQWQQWQAKRVERAKVRQVNADQQPCLDFVMPATAELVYEEDPAAALKLTSANAGYTPVRMQINNMLATTAAWSPPAQRGSVPDAWGTFCKRSVDIERGLGCDPQIPVVFLGTRTIVRGETLLVVVQFESRPQLDAIDPGFERPRMNAVRRLIVSTFHPGSGSTRPRRIGTWTLNLFLPPTGARVDEANNTWIVTRPALLTMFTAQADPKDASHFTLPYRVNGRAGVIDGWLQAQGPLLQPQEGQAVNFGGNERAWHLPVPPATQPAAF
jgi:hypothetical protein